MQRVPLAPDTEWWRLEVTPDDWAEEPPQLLARLLEQLLRKSAHGPGHADAVALHLPMKRHAMESEPGGGARHVSSGVAQCAHDRILLGILETREHRGRHRCRKDGEEWRETRGRDLSV